MKTLFINACVRENSRTLFLARDIIARQGLDVEELQLQREKLLPLDCETLAERDRLIKAQNWDAPMFRYARQFAEADRILIAAPFWDLSFPSLLKIYLEHISVTGITFNYKNGIPEGLCRADRLTYVTTAGGKIFMDFGYEYVKALANNFYGIKSAECYRAEELDVYQIPAERLLTDAEIIHTES